MGLYKINLVKLFVFEIQDEHGRWLHVDYWIFRSWGGNRRVNGRDFHGPVFYLGTTTRIAA